MVDVIYNHFFRTYLLFPATSSCTSREIFLTAGACPTQLRQAGSVTSTALAQPLVPFKSCREICQLLHRSGGTALKHALQSSKIPCLVAVMCSLVHLILLAFCISLPQSLLVLPETTSEINY